MATTWYILQSQRILMKYIDICSRVNSYILGAQCPTVFQMKLCVIY